MAETRPPGVKEVRARRRCEPGASRAANQALPSELRATRSLRLRRGFVMPSFACRRGPDRPSPLVTGRHLCGAGSLLALLALLCASPVLSQGVSPEYTAQSLQLFQAAQSAQSKKDYQTGRQLYELGLRQ